MSKDKDEILSYTRSPDQSEPLTLKISSSLRKKLIVKAEQEGVGLEEFVSELLAEGLVLRAWEIMERKGTLGSKGMSNSSNGYNRQKSYAHHHVEVSKGSGSGSKKHGGYQRVNRYSKIMDDNAHFIEYVRNQEKKSR